MGQSGSYSSQHNEDLRGAKNGFVLPGSFLVFSRIYKPKSMGFNYTALKNRNFEIKGQANTQNTTSIYNAYTSSICCMHKSWQTKHLSKTIIDRTCSELFKSIASPIKQLHRIFSINMHAYQAVYRIKWQVCHNVLWCSCLYVACPLSSPNYIIS